jgi:GT2 family glycosyltransferase
MQELLLPSLRKIGKSEGNLLIDNTTHFYSSCAKAYNMELDNHPGNPNDILIFLHQDIAFDDDVFLCRIVAELTDNPMQILGFAGMHSDALTRSNLRYFRTKEYIVRTHTDSKCRVESLDECCFAMTRNLFNRIKFDEVTCDHWHLYAVDFCYEARRRLGVESYVLPESIYHKLDGSTGLSTDVHFFSTLIKLRKKYYKDYTSIMTPCFIGSTSIIPFYRRVVRMLIEKNSKAYLNRMIGDSFYYRLKSLKFFLRRFFFNSAI